MIDLSEEQRQALQTTADAPVRLTDSRTRREYVLVRADVYERLRRGADPEEIDPSLYEFDEADEPRP
jgi:hypothetical protein